VIVTLTVVVPDTEMDMEIERAEAELWKLAVLTKLEMLLEMLLEMHLEETYVKVTVSEVVISDE
jgi:hypothetical protein